MATGAGLVEELWACLETSDQLVSYQACESPRNSTGAMDVGVPSPLPLSSPLAGLCIPGAQAERPKTRKEKESLRKKKYQQRLKNEREALLRMKAQLSVRLFEMKQSRRRGKFRVSTHVDDLNPVWRQLAVQQRGLRLRAENDQLRLVDALSIQASYIDVLASLLRRQTGELEGVNTPITSSLWEGLRLDHVLYTVHLRGVDACYARFNELYKECDFRSMPEGVVTSLHRSKSDGEMEYFQHLNKVCQPFTYEQTSNTMWTLAKLLHRQDDREDYEGLGDPDSIVAIKYRLVRALASGVKVSIRQRYVFRRFVEDCRTVFVWKTHSEGEGIFHGMHLHETGWVSLRPSADGASTLVEICVRQRPMRFSKPSFRNEFIGDFQHVLQSSTDEDAQEIIGTLDKLLIEDTLAGIDL